MRSRNLLMLVALPLILSCQATNELKIPDPEVCQPQLVLADIPTDAGIKVMVDTDKSYWFCVKRSDPTNEKFHRRPKFLDYTKKDFPIAVSLNDYKALNQFEVDGRKYIAKLEKQVEECNARIQTTNPGQAQ